MKIKFFSKGIAKFETISIGVFGTFSIVWIFIVTFTLLSFSRVMSARIFSIEYGGILPEDYVRITVYTLIATGIIYIVAGIILAFSILIFHYMRSFREIRYSKFWIGYNYLLRILALVVSSLFVIIGIMMISKSFIFAEYYYRALQELAEGYSSSTIAKVNALFEYGKRQITESIGGYIFILSLCLSLFGLLLAIYLSNWGDENGILGGILLGIGSFFLSAITIILISFLAVLGWILIAVGLIRIYKYEVNVEKIVSDVEEKAKKIFGRKKRKFVLRYERF